MVTSADLRPELLRRTHAQTLAALGPATDSDWSVRAGELEWTCWQTAVHLADSYFAHAARIAAQPRDGFVPGEVQLSDSDSPAQVLQTIGACAELVCCAAAQADPASRAWHPWGTCDPAGSVAMSVVEGLVHTYDIARPLGLDWYPPTELCEPALRRLFPTAPDGDPADVLLWCTGRIAMFGRPRRTSWRWYGNVPN